MVIGIVALVFVIRLWFLKISVQHEQMILKNGGREYGVKNTKALTLLHILFYILSVVEALIKHTQVDILGLIGIVLLVFSMCMLYLVQSILGDIWTVKLMIANNHTYNDHILFRLVKHPNYYLNIIPELVGLTLLCHSWWAALVLAPFYTLVLWRRIREEEELLETVILPNS
ncbi:isoprenylcysteine carboxyl methyltransferase family protein [Streptococcus respiraculi]|uniref:isoprenylcysteine carboxyl methyltransferase family protein n=1 Tax=Streptococcus respiraculi TaxID=2021971 RepID=UPI000E7241B1|nr:isoprenylcysteine carboxyl methyltransferase family protein [Streptococcus respiraculi]